MAYQEQERLRRLLGGPETAWLLERVRSRIAQGRALDGTLTLAQATEQQRRALERLLGRAPGGGRSVSVRLPELDTLLREAGLCADGLAGAVLSLTGPVPDLQAQAESEQLAWQRAHQPLSALAGRPELELWAAEAERSGVVKRLARGDAAAARELTANAAAVLALLPADGVALPVLAARALGDAHALDGDRALTTLVLGAVRALGELPTTSTASAVGRRQAWASVGVALDELSSRVLTLGLEPGLCDDEPAVLTLRRVRRRPPSFAGGTVFVCENPAVVAAAADELGATCPPLVCVEGRPSAAARALLGHLVARDARLAYHGDFDWGGVRIASGVLELPGATHWRYDAESYLAAVQRGLGNPLANGVPSDTIWDPPLRGAIERCGVRVEEEHLIPQLLTDLSDARVGGVRHRQGPAGPTPAP